MAFPWHGSNRNSKVTIDPSCGCMWFGLWYGGVCDVIFNHANRVIINAFCYQCILSTQLMEYQAGMLIIAIYVRVVYEVNNL